MMTPRGSVTPARPTAGPINPFRRNIGSKNPNFITMPGRSLPPMKDMQRSNYLSPSKRQAPRAGIGMPSGWRGRPEKQTVSKNARPFGR